MIGLVKRTLLAAALLAGALAAPSGAVPLVPVPWTSAGFGDTTPPRLSTDLNVGCGDHLQQGCAGGGAFRASHPISGSTVSLSTGVVDFSADLVSEIVGNTWTFGYRNVQLASPPVSTDATVDPGELAFLSISFVGGVTAVLDVPSVGGPFTDLLFAATAPGILGGGTVESSTFGWGAFPDVGSVQTLVAGDRLTFYTSFASYIDSYSPANTQESRIRETSYNTCRFTTEGIDLADCTISLSVFRPVNVPEPGSLGLLCASLAALYGRIRMRSA